MSFQSLARLSCTAPPDFSKLFPEIGDSAPDHTVTNGDGAEVKLSEYWSEKPTVLVFLRHFGCPFCREQVAMLRQDYLKFLAAGTEIVCIGQGPYKAGKAFAILLNLPFPVVVCGDDFSIYEKYGLGKGTIKQLAGVNVIVRGFAALRHGISLAPVIGDLEQMPGVFIVDECGTVQLAHRNADQADNITSSVLLKALRQESL